MLTIFISLLFLTSSQCLEKTGAKHEARRSVPKGSLIGRDHMIFYNDTDEEQFWEWKRTSKKGESTTRIPIWATNSTWSIVPWPEPGSYTPRPRPPSTQATTTTTYRTTTPHSDHTTPWEPDSEPNEPPYPETTDPPYPETTEPPYPETTEPPSHPSRPTKSRSRTTPHYSDTYYEQTNDSDETVDTDEIIPPIDTDIIEYIDHTSSVAPPEPGETDDLDAKNTDKEEKEKEEKEDEDEEGETVRNCGNGFYEIFKMRVPKGEEDIHRLHCNSSASISARDETGAPSEAALVVHRYWPRVPHYYIKELYWLINNTHFNFNVTRIICASQEKCNYTEQTRNTMRFVDMSRPRWPRYNELSGTSEDKDGNYFKIFLNLTELLQAHPEFKFLKNKKRMEEKLNCGNGFYVFFRIQVIEGEEDIHRLHCNSSASISARDKTGAPTEAALVVRRYWPRAPHYYIKELYWLPKNNKTHFNFNVTKTICASKTKCNYSETYRNSLVYVDASRPRWPRYNQMSGPGPGPYDEYAGSFEKYFKIYLNLTELVLAHPELDFLQDKHRPLAAMRQGAAPPRRPAAALAAAVVVWVVVVAFTA